MDGKEGKFRKKEKKTEKEQKRRETEGKLVKVGEKWSIERNDENRS